MSCAGIPVYDVQSAKYIKYKNKLTSINRIAERQFYYDKCELAKGNINKIWQTINSVIAGPSHKNDKHIKEIKYYSLFTIARISIVLLVININTILCLLLLVLVLYCW